MHVISFKTKTGKYLIVLSTVHLRDVRTNGLQVDSKFELVVGAFVSERREDTFIASMHIADVDCIPSMWAQLWQFGKARGHVKGSRHSKGPVRH
jgi:hypothetical protein